LVSALLLSCGPRPRPVLFPVRGVVPPADASAYAQGPLFGLGRKAAEGRLGTSKPQKFEYRFSSMPLILASVQADEPVSVEIEYSFSSPPPEYSRFVLDTGDTLWVLPVSAVLWEGLAGDPAGPNPGRQIFHYAVPVNKPVPERFSIALTGGKDKKRPGTAPDSALQVHSIEFKKRWFGFYRLRDVSGDHFFASPFVSRRPEMARNDSPAGASWIIDPLEIFAGPEGFFPELSAGLLPGKEALLELPRYRLEAFPRLARLAVPAGMLEPFAGPVLSGDRAGSFRMGFAKIPRFPVPIAADPGVILSWPQGRWRDSRYEVFRWENFPSLLVFDAADYAVQDRMLKRLAFFVEKAGFRGRLAPDSEIAGLHGWNAHDYRAADLARFFQAARQSDFPLLAEERELESILTGAGIIRESGGSLQAGEGGIISISRESEDYLRRRFMAHEGFHGLFFIDEDFREFSRRRWQQLDPRAKRFIFSYFGYQQYDTSDEYLVVNEFMAHILQQPVSQAAYYFGEQLPSRLEDSERRRADLPEKDTATGSWPLLARAFTREAEAFSAYVENRWGLAAGRVSLVTVKRL